MSPGKTSASVTLFSDRFCADNFMCVRINRQMQLPPDTTAFFAVLFNFPFAFTEDLQACRINHQMRDFTLGGRFKTDINRFCPLADTGVIRAAQRKNGINKALCGSQGQPEYAFNHQNGGDGKVRIAQRWLLLKFTCLLTASIFLIWMSTIKN